MSEHWGYKDAPDIGLDEKTLRAFAAMGITAAEAEEQMRQLGNTLRSDYLFSPMTTYGIVQRPEIIPWYSYPSYTKQSERMKSEADLVRSMVRGFKGHPELGMIYKNVVSQASAPGIPDLTFIVDGVVVFIEVKWGADNGLRSSQVTWIERAARQGASCLWITGERANGQIEIATIALRIGYVGDPLKASPLPGFVCQTDKSFEELFPSYLHDLVLSDEFDIAFGRTEPAHYESPED